MTNKTKDGDDNSFVLSTTQEILREDLIEVMADLSPRERDALNLRFGLEETLESSSSIPSSSNFFRCF